MKITAFVWSQIAHIFITAHNQRFYLADQQEWKMAGYLLPGDLLLSEAGPIPVKFLIRIVRPVLLCDLSVSDYHNFLVSKNGIVVHNIAPAIPPILLGIEFLFGLGAIEFGGFTLGLGAFTLCANGLVNWLKNRREEQRYQEEYPKPAAALPMQTQQDPGLRNTPYWHHVPPVPTAFTQLNFANQENSFAEAVKTCIVDSATQTAVQFAKNREKKKEKVQEKSKDVAGTKEDNDDGYKCPFHPGCRKEHPYGLYMDAGYHHINSQGSGKSGKSSAPIDGQSALDKSVGVLSKSGEIRRRVGLSCAQIVEFKPTRAMEVAKKLIPIWHGYVLTWQSARDEIKSALQKAGWADPRGRIKWPSSVK